MAITSCSSFATCIIHIRGMTVTAQVSIVQRSRLAPSFAHSTSLPVTRENKRQMWNILVVQKPVDRLLYKWLRKTVTVAALMDQPDLCG